jgi:hypothetical protein
VTIHFVLNWVMIGGACGAVAGLVLAGLGSVLVWSSELGGLLAALGIALLVAGIAAFFIGIGMAL